METVPARARVYVLCVAAAALLCLRPLPAAHTPWPAVLLLAVVYGGCERVAFRWQFAGTFFPVLLAGAFLLPPAAAALVAVPGALLSPVDDPPRGLRRTWRAAQLVL